MSCLVTKAWVNKIRQEFAHEGPGDGNSSAGVPVLRGLALLGLGVTPQMQPGSAQPATQSLPLHLKTVVSVEELKEGELRTRHSASTKVTFPVEVSAINIVQQ